MPSVIFRISVTLFTCLVLSLTVMTAIPAPAPQKASPTAPLPPLNFYPMASASAEYPLPPLPKTVSLFRTLSGPVYGMQKSGNMLYVTMGNKLHAINTDSTSSSTDSDIYVGTSSDSFLDFSISQVDGTFFIVDTQSIIQTDEDDNRNSVCGINTYCGVLSNKITSILGFPDGNFVVSDYGNARLCELVWNVQNGWTLVNCRSDGNTYDALCPDPTNPSFYYAVADNQNPVKVYRFQYANISNTGTVAAVFNYGAQPMPSCAKILQYSGKNDVLFILDAFNEKIQNFPIPAGNTVQNLYAFSGKTGNGISFNYNLTKYSVNVSSSYPTAVSTAALTQLPAVSVPVFTYGYDARLWFSDNNQILFIWDPDFCPVTFPSNTHTSVCNAPPNVTGAAKALNCPNPIYIDTQNGNPCGQFTINRYWYHYETGKSSYQTIQTEYTPISMSVSEPPLTVECSSINTALLQYQPTVTSPCSTGFYRTVTNLTEPGTCVGSYKLYLNYTIGDVCITNISLSQNFTVVDTTPPTAIYFPPDMIFECSQFNPLVTNTGIPTVVDNCDPNPVFYHSDSVAMSDCGMNFVMDRTWSLTDSCQNTRNYTQQIFVNQTIVPVLLLPKDIIISCNSSYDTSVTGVPRVIDCYPYTLTYEDEFISSDCYSFLILRTWNLTDSCNQISRVQRILVQDTTPPVISVPPTVYVGCTDDMSVQALGQATVTDNCDNNPTLTYVDGPIGLCYYTQVRTWTAVDSCGNTASANQHINVIDNVAPIFIGQPPPQQVSIPCVQVVPDGINPAISGQIYKYMVTDNCSRVISIVYYDDISNLYGSNGCIYGTAIRTWSVIDECKNVLFYVQSITLDNAAGSPHFSFLYSFLLAMVLAFCVWS